MVTVTHLDTREVSVLRTDALGQFTLESTPGDHAFAVTTATGFAFLDKLAVPARDLAITLSSACHRLQGRVVGKLALPATVNLSRISNDTGDRFIAAIAGDGTFTACLPEGTYSTHVEGAMVSLEGPVVVPATGVIELTGYPTSTIQRAPTSVSIANADLESFVRSLADRRIVGLGEANHGTGDFYTHRGRLSLELARSGKLRTILIEADAIAMLAIEDYVMGADVEIAKAVADIKFWITDIREYLTVLADVRSYNASVPPARKIHVLGIDAQRIEPPVRFLLAHRAELAISDPEADLLTRIAPNAGAAFANLSIEENATLFALLDRLATSSSPADLAANTTRATIAARSVRHQLGYVGKVGTAALRDLAMAELAAHIIDLGGSGQAAVWGHNGHIARQPDGASKSLGQHLFERFGEAYYPIAFLSYRGEARAWDAAGKIGVIPHQLAPTPPYHLESVIMNATKFVDVAWVGLDTASRSLEQWLSLPRYVREFGSAYSPSNTQTLRAFPAAVAAVVVIEHASASTPTPTGIRMVKQ